MQFTIPVYLAKISVAVYFTCSIYVLAVMSIIISCTLFCNPMFMPVIYFSVSMEQLNW